VAPLIQSFGSIDAPGLLQNLGARPIAPRPPVAA
jgi:hypothetical protein